MEQCEVCRFEWDAIAADEMPVRLRVAAAGFAEALAAEGSSPYDRAGPQMWSAIEYAAHARDVLLNLRERIICGVAEDNPTPKAMFAAVRLAAGVYAGESVEALPAEMTVATELLCRTLEALTPEVLARPIFYPYPVPATRTLLWVGAQAVHEMEHHLDDVRTLMSADVVE